MLWLDELQTVSWEHGELTVDAEGAVLSFEAVSEGWAEGRYRVDLPWAVWLLVLSRASHPQPQFCSSVWQERGRGIAYVHACSLTLTSLDRARAEVVIPLTESLVEAVRLAWRRMAPEPCDFEHHGPHAVRS